MLFWITEVYISRERQRTSDVSSFANRLYAIFILFFSLFFSISFQFHFFRLCTYHQRIGFNNLTINISTMQGLNLTKLIYFQSLTLHRSKNDSERCRLATQNQLALRKFGCRRKLKVGKRKKRKFNSFNLDVDFPAQRVRLESLSTTFRRFRST